MFEDLFNLINSNILSHGGKELELEENLSENFSYKGNAVIRSWLWDVPGFRRWRVTRMDAGNKIQVLNSVAYPDYINSHPILGIDLLWFGVKNKLVAVLDFQPLVQDEKYFLQYYQGLKLLHENYSDFNTKKTMNIYDANRYFSPWVLLYSGDFNKLKIPLNIVLEKFLFNYWKIHANKLYKYKKLSDFDVKELHRNYDIYSCERDPAHGLFKSYFGEEWADNFLQNFLFPLSNRI